jgi:dTDP-4-dehydrorhamnose reductase
MIWLVGAQGLLGGYVRRHLDRNGVRFVGTDREVDITDQRALNDFAGGRQFTAIVNCAGFTDVRACETHEEEAFRANATAVRHLAAVAANRGARLVHVSTDYVFDGAAAAPYPEEALPNPLNAYGRSKLAGERHLMTSGCRWTIVRTSWLFGEGGYNFVNAVLDRLAERGSMRVVDDQFGRPTYAADLAAAILDLTEAAPGLYHFANAGVTSWFTYATEIVRIAVEREFFEKRPELVPVSSAAFRDPVVRPAYSALATEKITRALGREPRPWPEALRDFMLHELNQFVG